MLWGFDMNVFLILQNIALNEIWAVLIVLFGRNYFSPWCLQNTCIFWISCFSFSVFIFVCYFACRCCNIYYSIFCMVHLFYLLKNKWRTDTTRYALSKLLSVFLFCQRECFAQWISNNSGMVNKYTSDRLSTQSTLFTIPFISNVKHYTTL